MKPLKNEKSVLIVSKDTPFASQMSENLALNGYHIVNASSQETALKLLEKESVAVAFLDLETIVIQEFDLVHYIKTNTPFAEIVIIATLSQIDKATAALKRGAAFYLLKPIKPTDIKLILDKLALRVERQREHHQLEQQVLSDLMAGSAAMEKVLKIARKIAPTTSTVLISGESGTGKEFFARIIHRMSHRPEGPFVATNCGAIPDTLFESELFGYRKGAFTGADRDKSGLCEEAHQGTLFLDEVSELSLGAQVKLLRFLQEKTFHRIGDPTERSVDTRILAATNKDLITLIQAGRFREDLYFRLNVFGLHLPPLRERRETIPNLIRLFVHRNNLLLNKQVNHLSKAAEILLAQYEFPGNIRELENIIEHAMVLCDTNEITEHDLPEFVFSKQLLIGGPHAVAVAVPPLQLPSLSGTAITDIAPLSDIERAHIQKALIVYNHNYSETAQRLGISRSTLWRKMKEYALEKR